MGRIRKPGLWELVWKAALLHTASYFLIGLAALTVMDYATLFAQAPWSGWMRPVSDPLVAAGPLFQPLRGALFGLALWLVRDAVFGPGGWLKIWGLLVLLGIWNTFAAAVGSIEGAIYTQVPPLAHLWPGQPEVLLQSLALAVGLNFWVLQGRNLPLALAAGGVAALAMAASVAGVMIPA